MRYIISSALTSLCLSLGLCVPAQAKVPQVVADIPPVHALVAQVMGDLGDPVLLLAKGASEHDFQLRPSQAKSLAEADLVVWIGPELTPWLDRALSGLNRGGRLALLDAPETARRDFAADGAHMPGRHGAAAHDEESRDEDGHADGNGHTGTDPHAWLDPDNAKSWLALIAARLSALDPENAATYAANAAAAQARIAATDARIADRFAATADRPIIVYHDAYGYFAQHYGLSILGSVALGDATAPGAAKLAALRDLIGSSGTTCIFPEAQHDPALAERLAEGTPLHIGAALDPVGSTLTPGPDAYEALLVGLAEAMTGCLSTL